jgi:hypothetical protein
MRLLRTQFTRTIQIRDKSALYDEWLQYVTENAVRRDGPRSIEFRARFPHGPSDSPRTPKQIAFAAGDGSFVAKLAGKYCLVTVGTDTRAGTPTTEVNHAPKILTIEALFGKKSSMNRMRSCVETMANIHHNRLVVDVAGRHGMLNRIHLPKRDPKTLCLPAGMYESLETKLSAFLKSKELYNRLGVPWRYGVLLQGDPGTGKTSIAQALASELSARLKMIPLSEMDSDSALSQQFMGEDHRVVYLIEDVDCAFIERKQANMTYGVTMAGLLNAIDGVASPQNGRILIMTTNHPEKLDPALVRSRRVDATITVPHISPADAAAYASRMFPGDPEMQRFIRDMVATREKVSGADLATAVMDRVSGCSTQAVDLAIA